MNFNLTEWALNHRAIVLFLILVIGVGGTLGFTQLGQLLILRRGHGVKGQTDQRRHVVQEAFEVKHNGSHPGLPNCCKQIERTSEAVNTASCSAHS